MGIYRKGSYYIIHTFYHEPTIPVTLIIYVIHIKGAKILAEVLAAKEEDYPLLSPRVTITSDPDLRPTKISRRDLSLYMHWHPVSNIFENHIKGDI